MPIHHPITHPDPNVSVVIPTIPENEYEVPPALVNQTADKYEVIVVSDASINRCEARNRGIKTAEADVIAQTDDDCRPPVTWIERIANHFDSDPELVLLEGFLDKLDREPRGYVGANLAYRKESALKIGGFDSALSGWRADTDFGWRMEDEYGVEHCQADTMNVIEHIGPLRTTVNRSLERKFRMRHPQKYFSIIFDPDIRYSYEVGLIIGKIYSVNPRLGEKIIKKRTLINKLRDENITTNV
ncbi:Glycosyl transferase family 2 [Halorientalis persicus]|uniref:Glycosyl transferase family 2 n=1 Tax=Halorientalis persicus TaxID=1367881 RepID=A0A1H8WU38_9EURY|nr:glycosyltransferase family A protein [Halorientalis persicus]SEP31141.1 Glycosyl transferase family 2 [Halorientalis persicus]